MRRIAARRPNAPRWARFAAPVLALALLASVASAGLLTFWCPAMQQSSLRCCCAHPVADRSTPPPDTLSRECCEAHRGAPLPSATPDPHASLAVLPAALAFTLPLDIVFGAPRVGLSVPRERRHEARAGPPLRVHREISVFLL